MADPEPASGLASALDLELDPSEEWLRFVPPSLDEQLSDFAAVGVSDVALVQLAIHNGISADEVTTAMRERVSLEMFMGKHNSMAPLRHFQSLQCVTVCHEPAIECIEGFGGASSAGVCGSSDQQNDSRDSLRELWVNHCSVRLLGSSLAGLSALTLLNVSSNGIASLDGVQAAPALRELWANDNEIGSDDDAVGTVLVALPRLRVVWLARNRLRALPQLPKSIECVNVADNFIGTSMDVFDELDKMQFEISSGGGHAWLARVRDAATDADEATIEEDEQEEEEDEDEEEGEEEDSETDDGGSRDTSDERETRRAGARARQRWDSGQQQAHGEASASSSASEPQLEQQSEIAATVAQHAAAMAALAAADAAGVCDNANVAIADALASMAAARLVALEDIVNAVKAMPALRTLHLSDPHFGSNDVCLVPSCRAALVRTALQAQARGAGLSQRCCTQSCGSPSMNSPSDCNACGDARSERAVLDFVLDGSPVTDRELLELRSATLLSTLWRRVLDSGALVRWNELREDARERRRREVAEAEAQAVEAAARAAAISKSAQEAAHRRAIERHTRRMQAGTKRGCLATDNLSNNVSIKSAKPCFHASSWSAGERLSERAKRARENKRARLRRSAGNSRRIRLRGQRRLGHNMNSSGDQKQGRNDNARYGEDARGGGSEKDCDCGNGGGGSDGDSDEDTDVGAGAGVGEDNDRTNVMNEDIDTDGSDEDKDNDSADCTVDAQNMQRAVSMLQREASRCETKGTNGRRGGAHGPHPATDRARLLLSVATAITDSAVTRTSSTPATVPETVPISASHEVHTNTTVRAVALSSSTPLVGADCLVDPEPEPELEIELDVSELGLNAQQARSQSRLSKSRRLRSRSRSRSQSPARPPSRGSPCCLFASRSMPQADLAPTSTIVPTTPSAALDPAFTTPTKLASNLRKQEPSSTFVLTQGRRCAHCNATLELVRCAHGCGDYLCREHRVAHNLRCFDEQQRKLEPLQRTTTPQHANAGQTGIVRGHASHAHGARADKPSGNLSGKKHTFARSCAKDSHANARARAPTKHGQYARASDTPPVSFRVPLTAEFTSECSPSQATISHARASIISPGAVASCASPPPSISTTRSVLYSPISVQSPKALFPASTSSSVPELSPSKGSARFSLFKHKHHDRNGERTAVPRTGMHAHSYEYDV